MINTDTRGHKKLKSKGFTIVELLIVIVVIAILAVITTVAYNGVSNRAQSSAAQSGARQGYSLIARYSVENGEQYPANLTATGLPLSGSTLFEYSVNNATNPRTFCLTASVSGTSYYVSESTTTPISGRCSGHYAGEVGDGINMQSITAANCPTDRIRAVDARDNHTYWVQKLADGKCWMLTNLGYAGGGANTYGDVKTLANGTGIIATSYIEARYYVIPSTNNYTTEPTAPTTSTTGTGQYGYLYNWCAAMGGQLTAACANASTPTPITSVTICPAGWRLPSGGPGGEFTALNTALNNGSTTINTGLLSSWLAQKGGYWNTSFASQGARGDYSSSVQITLGNVYTLSFSNSSVNPSSNVAKYVGAAVRCVAI